MKLTAQDVFHKTMRQMKEEKVLLSYPKEILWVCGPPASGKSSICNYLMKELNYTQVVAMREICNAVVARNNGKFDMGGVIGDFIRLIFTADPSEKIVIDDFVSISCAHIVPLIHKAMKRLEKEREENNPSRFRICAFTIGRENSVVHQQTKDPSLTTETAIELFEKFNKRSEQVINFLAKYFQFSVVDANLPLSKVKEIAQLECCNKLNGRPKIDGMYFDGMRGRARGFPRGPPPRGYNGMNMYERMAQHRAAAHMYFAMQYQQPYSPYMVSPKQPGPPTVEVPDVVSIAHILKLQREDESAVKEIVDKVFGPVLGQYLQHMTASNVDQIEKNNTIRVQYYFRPATSFNAYIFITQSTGYLIDTKWNVWRLPLTNFPQADTIIMFGKLFHLQDGDFVFLACDVTSDQTKEFNIDRRSRMIVKVAKFLNEQNLPIPVKVNLFVPLDEHIIEPIGKVRFSDVILPVSGLVFSAKNAQFLFDKENPGFVWQFADRLVTIGKIKENFTIPVTRKIQQIEESAIDEAKQSPPPTNQ